MELKTIDAVQLKKAFLSGAALLERKKDWINELNVFPVPDGDTGTNMTLTILSAVKAVTELENPGMSELCRAISSGSLRGARGNSGVILSQLLRGFTKEIRDRDSVDIPLLVSACQRATETAYKAVMKPKEGTILTVARGMSDKAKEIAESSDDILVFLNTVTECGNQVLAETPEMLPVLKQAGVVDSGGQGLMTVIRGAVDALAGKETEFDEALPESEKVSGGKGSVDTSALETSDIKFGYCTEFIVNLNGRFSPEDESTFKAYLESIGDSIVCVADDEMVKVHVHTNNPGLAIEKGLSYGSLSRLKIDNMREEHNERLIKDASRIAAEEKAGKEDQGEQPHKKYGFVSVSSGSGLSDIFRSVGVDCLIEGGQTMNPSTDDVLQAVAKVNADTVFVLPNNKNIILAAEQAQHMCKDRNIVVVPSKNIPQGITALINFMPDSSPEDNLKLMTEEMSKIKTCEITYAVRDTSIDGFDIRENDIMAIGDHGMLTIGKNINETIIDAVKKMVDEHSELISLYYGESIKEEDAGLLSDLLNQNFSDTEVEVHNGGQPVYYYLISVE